MEDYTKIDRCPICNTVFASSQLGSRDAVLDNLSINLVNLDKYRKAEAEKEDAKKALDLAADNLKVKLTEFFRWCDIEYRHGVIINYGNALQSWNRGDEAPSSKDVTETLARLYSTVAGAIEEARRGQSTYRDALNTARSLLETKVDLAKIKRVKSNLADIKVNLDHQTAIFHRAVVQHIQGLVDRLESEAREIYKEIQGPKAPMSTIEITFPEEGRRIQRSAHIIIDFMNTGKKVPPHSILSESQTRTLALAIRLAAISIFNTEFKVIALDDVTMSYDEERRQHIAALLKERFSEYQIILTTHDEFFYERLKERLPSRKCMFKEISQVVDGYGPKIDDKKTLEMIVNEEIEGNMPVGNTIRQVQEEWLTHICADFKTSVYFEPGKRLEFNDLATSLKRFLNDQGLAPPKVKGYSGNYLDLMMESNVLNITSHYNKYQNRNISNRDLKPIWNDFLTFKSYFACPKCGADRFTREHGHKPRCQACEVEFTFASNTVNT